MEELDRMVLFFFPMYLLYGVILIIGTGVIFIQTLLFHIKVQKEQEEVKGVKYVMHRKIKQILFIIFVILLTTLNCSSAYASSPTHQPTLMNSSILK